MVTACAFSCNKGDEGSATVTKKTAVDETTVPENASLCKEEYLGKKPMVIAYYTENSKELPNPAYLTHINYAHGRFANPKTGDGGITVASPDLLKKVVALKSQNPDLKVLLPVLLGVQEAHRHLRPGRYRHRLGVSRRRSVHQRTEQGRRKELQHPAQGAPRGDRRHKDNLLRFVLQRQVLRLQGSPPLSGLCERHDL